MKVTAVAMQGKSFAIRADRLFAATGDPLTSNGVVLVENDRIAAVGNSAELASRLEHLVVHDYGDATVMPGLVDAHTHLTLAGDGRSYEEMVLDPDEMMAITAVRNLQAHLASGVTTLRDNGGRNRVTFVVREAMRRGYFVGPRMLLAGRPLTQSGGHFHWCNGVADGATQIQSAIRRLVSEGADHIKIMASGGATAGNSPHLAAYGIEELRGAVDTAHGLGRLTTAHCRSTSSITNALEAGLDCIEHAGFLMSYSPFVNSVMKQPSVQQYDRDVAARIVDSGSFVSYTLPTGGGDGSYDDYVMLQRKSETTGVNADETATLGRFRTYFDQKLEIFNNLMNEGLVPRLAISTDAGPQSIKFGQMHHVFDLAVQGGMNPAQAVEAGTRVAAEACGVLDAVGTLSPGKFADILVIGGDPLSDLRQISDVRAVFVGGVLAHARGEGVRVPELAA